MINIAVDMLLGDKIKYLILISAIAFSTLLITQQTAIFWGVMRWTTTMLRNTNVPIWVVDSHVVQITDINPMKDTELARVRSISGVKWASPFYYNLLQAKVANGNFTMVQLMGADSFTLLGIPPEIQEGQLENLWKKDAVFLDKTGIKKLGVGLKNPLKVGDSFDLNDHEVRIAGIVNAEQSFFGYPFVYTTFDRAVELAPSVRRNLSFILVEAEPDVNYKELAIKIQDETGLRAFTKDEFFWATIKWFFFNTGIPVSFGSTIVLGFFVGIAVTGQTFYSFIHENIGNLGALKAMGADNSILYRMLVVQATIAGLIGYGIGIGMTAMLGLLTYYSEKIPFYLTWQIPLITLAMIIIICLFSVYLGFRKISQIDPAEVFRGQ
ncbi:MAG: ABC transporter permease [Parachlamydia sp.]|nr:MAG: ABC transporter permease [Parachlamydia sp.]